MEIFSYLFWPNPGMTTYGNPKVVLILLFCTAFLVATIGLRLWRKKMGNPILRKLSKSWPSASLWFGVSGFILTISRVEGVSYLSMRFLWIVWGVVLILFVLLQVKVLRLRYYKPLPKELSLDPLEKYLPRSKRRK